MRNRKSGVLLHITSLPSDFGIGDLGPGAFRFADFLSESNQRYWQVLPLNPTSTAFGNSPYSGPSIFAGNTLLISPVVLEEQGLIGKRDMEEIETASTEEVDYQTATRIKQQITDAAYNNLLSDGNDEITHDFNRFCEENSYWLDDYAMFMVLKEEFSQAPWNKWPEEFRDRDKTALEKVRERKEARIRKIRYSQYLFYRQWFSLKKYCNDRDIKIIGDLPIYPNFDSSDVWNNQEFFKLDNTKNPLFCAGVPPDYFSSTGQLWGNPVYDWDRLGEDGYRWWIKRFGHNFNITDIVRVDHFRGFVAYWEVLYGHKTAMEGEWVDVPVDEFFTTVKKHFESLPVIAEDLGTITSDVYEVMDRYGFPGMKILIFAFGDDFPDGYYLPHNYPRNCVVYTGTHDNNTVKGWFRKEADNFQKERLSKYAGVNIDQDNVSWEMIRLAMSSVADTAIIPMQDILGLDERGMMNLPSTSSGNWRWRIKGDYFSKETVNRLREITSVYGRG